MSRQELAEAVNAWAYEHAGRVCSLDASYIGVLERGETRWPRAHHRAGLRAALGAATDAEIGLWIIKNPGGPTGTTGDSAGTEPAAAAVPSLPKPEAHRAESGGVTTLNALTPPEVAAVQVHVSAGAAVTVVCQEGAAGRVAVVAGGVQVLIEVSGADPASVTPTVVDVPAVSGGARVYSLAERRAP